MCILKPISSTLIISNSHIKLYFSIKKVALWYTYTHIEIYENTHTVTHTYIHTYIRGVYDKFPDFFVWALLLIQHTWNSSPLRSNLLQLQCICSTVPITSGRLHGSPLVRACQWPSSQPLSSPQLSHNDSLWA